MANETKKTQHTPGPWVADVDRGMIRGAVRPSDSPPGFGLACVVPGYLGEGRDEMEQDSAFLRANARLIAAAPDLLEALKDLLDRAERQAAGMLVEASCEVWYAHRDAARAAIAKAGGK